MGGHRGALLESGRKYPSRVSMSVQVDGEGLRSSCDCMSAARTYK